MKEEDLIVVYVGSLAGGGGERVVIYLLKWLSMHHLNTVLMVHGNSGEYSELVPSNVTIVPVGISFGRLGFIRRIQAVRNKIIELKPRIVLSFMTPANISLMRAFGLVSHPFKIILNVQNNLDSNVQINKSSLYSRLRRIETKILYNLSDRVVCASNGIRDSLHSEWGIDGKKLSVVSNPVDCASVRDASQDDNGFKYIFRKDTPVIIAVGRLVEQKGYGDMIDVFASIRSERLCNLLILGQGPLENELRQKIAALGLTDDIKLIGFVKNPWKYIRRSTLFLSTSYWEGLPLILLEVMALGIPAVCTDCDYGPREVIDNKRNGFLVPVGDLQEIAERVSTVLAMNREERLVLSKEAMCRASDFDTKVFFEKYSKILQELV